MWLTTNREKKRVTEAGMRPFEQGRKHDELRLPWRKRRMSEEEKEEEEGCSVCFREIERGREVEEKRDRQMYDGVSDPHGGEGIHPLTAAFRPDEVWPSGGRTGPEDFPLLQNTSCLLFSCNVTTGSLLPCHTLTCTICYFCVTPCAHRLHSWLFRPFQPWTHST